MKRWHTALAAGGLMALLSFGLACGSTPIRHYQPSIVADRVEHASKPTADVVLAVRTFSSDAAYDDQRIVYRKSDLRFDYYHFHRWSTEPGQMVSAALREAYRHSGRFRAVVAGLDPRAEVILGGRIVALEEVDVSDDEWRAHVTVELSLRDNRTGNILWHRLVEESEPLKEQSPEGLARALSVVLTRIGSDTAPEIAREAATVAK